MFVFPLFQDQVPCNLFDENFCLRSIGGLFFSFPPNPTCTVKDGIFPTPWVGDC